MPGPAAILKEVHRLRRHAHELQSQIDRGPAVLKAQQAKLGKQQDALRDAQEGLKKLKMAIHEKEVSLKAKAQQVDKHQLQLNSASSKKEYDALKNEIAHEKEASKELEDEILTAMLRLDEGTARLPELERSLRRAEEEVAQFEKSHRARLADLASQLDQARQQLTAVEATLPEDIRPAYDRLASARGEDAMSAVANRTCSACYTEITAQNSNDLVQGQFVLCKSCGRILYLAE
jgi:predicted  nucleic acid-binding Zn-ribbon protein